MGVFVELLVGLAVLLILYLFSVRNKRKMMPPGEWGWPIIGYIRPPQEYLGDTIKRLQKKHGDVFTWKFGGRTYVYLCKFETMKKVLNGPDVNIRPEFFSFKNFTKGRVLGIFNTSGDMWHNTRRFTMKNLKDLGLGKSFLETAIEMEAKILVDNFKNYVDKPTKIPITLSVTILNIIWKMVADIRYDLEDTMIKRFQNMIIEIFDEFQGNVARFDAYPIFEKIVPRSFYKLCGISSYVDKSKVLLDYLGGVIRQHRAELDPENPKDFIDEFIIEIEKNGNNNPAFTSDNLEGTIADLFANGSESTASTIRWILIYLAKYPEIQAKLQKEIDEVVPRDSLPTTLHRNKLNYTEAVFHEVQRLISLIPTTFPRISEKDITIDGFHVPKDTIIIGAVEGCQFDSAYWERPSDFYPEHFLDEDGKFKPKKDGYAPFSIGRRICPGESLAKLNIYLIGSALLQNFTFSTAPGEVISLARDPAQTTINMPPDPKLIIRNRT